MILVFCVEDETDEAVLRIFLSRLLKEEVHAFETTYRFPMGGWQAALKLAPIMARDAYNKGLDGAVFAIDNDGAVAHEETHQREATCRWCRLHVAADINEPQKWRRKAGLQDLYYLFAVPVQLMETWLLLAVGEYDFKGREHSLGANPRERQQMKRALYGVENPDRLTIRRVALPIASTVDLTSLAQRSPSFRQFAEQTRPSAQSSGASSAAVPPVPAAAPSESKNG